MGDGKWRMLRIGVFRWGRNSGWLYANGAASERSRPILVRAKNKGNWPEGQNVSLYVCATERRNGGRASGPIRDLTGTIKAEKSKTAPLRPKGAAHPALVSRFDFRCRRVVEISAPSARLDLRLAMRSTIANRSLVEIQNLAFSSFFQDATVPIGDKQKCFVVQKNSHRTFYYWIFLRR